MGNFLMFGGRMSLLVTSWQSMIARTKIKQEIFSGMKILDSGIIL